MSSPFAALPSPEALRFTGELDLYHVEQARDALLARLAEPSAFVLDLTEVTACDAAGLQLLLAARRSAQRAGNSFALVGVSPAVARCAERLGVPVETWNRAEALSAT